MTITKLSGSSWIKIKNNNRVIHFDPGYMGDFNQYHIPNLDFFEAGDLILISHAHQDHLQPKAFAKIRRNNSIILAPKICEGIIEKPYQIVKPGEEIIKDDYKIQVVPAYNTPEGHSTRKAHHKGDGVGYLVTINQKTFYHAGDTDVIPEMDEFSPIDIAFIPIGGTYTMDISEAVQATQIIQPKIVIPMHFLSADPEEFKKLVEEKSSIQAIIVKPGESIEI